MKSLLLHQYPSFISKHPKLIILNYWFHSCITLRKWHIVKELKQIIASKKVPFRFMEVGFGDGQYLVSFAQRYPKSIFQGFDKIIDNVIFVNKLLQSKSIKNLQVWEGDIINFTPSHQQDIITCIGVLQYIPDDQMALNNLYLNCAENGTLLLYVPIYQRFVLSFYKGLFLQYQHYDTVHNKKRNYTEIEVINKLIHAGFNIDKKIYTYGTLGIISNEIFNSVVIVLQHFHFLFKVIAVLFFIGFLPLYLVLMIIDFYTPKKNGNGLMVIAKKSPYKLNRSFYFFLSKAPNKVSACR